MAAVNLNPAVTTALNESPSVNPKLRKRTKTGCLTCRKRRIKCGEERPTCNNCVKSKRHCEGYNQRVIFKPPIGDWPGAHHGADTLPYHNGLLPGTSPALQRPAPPPIQTHDPTGAQLHPRPLYGVPINEHGQPLAYASPGMVTTQVNPQYQTQQQATPLPSPFNVPPSYIAVSPSHFQPIFSEQALSQAPLAISSHTWPQPPLQSPPQTEASQFNPQPAIQQTQDFDFARQAPQVTSPQQPPTPASTAQDFKPVPVSVFVPTPSSSSTLSTATLQINDGVKREESVPHWPPNTGPGSASSHETAPNPLTNHNQAYHAGIINPTVSVFPTVEPVTIQTPIPISATQAIFPGAIVDHVVSSPHDFLDDAAVEQEDDDYYDVMSDDEMDLAPSQAVIQAYQTQNDFSVMLAIHRDSTNELSMRRYDNFIYSGILDHYRPELSANPLKNRNTARVFMHFITATGPTLSIFERHPRNTSALFDEVPQSTPRPGLWTYTMPLLALNHQGLLHAMLAVSSLHIAKLQGASLTPSFKHYMYAVKRLNRCVGNPKKKYLSTTLAATLLLAFYEVITAEHLKWCSHLLGAKSIISELDYLSMARDASRWRAEVAGQANFYHQGDGVALQQGPFDNPLENIQPPIDENIISALFGKKVSYDDFGRIVDEPNGKRRESFSQPFDMSRFELYQDLWWWFIKQDCFQSVISGNPLLLDYNRWAECPPRANIGRIDALYGTSDHLFLLLGRVADFTARDRARKIQVVEANGGVWRPAPGMNMPAPPGGAPPGGAPRPGTGPPPGPPPMQNFSGQQGPPQAQQMPNPPNPPKPMPTPSFYGMAPTPATFRAPPAYQAYTSSPSSQSPKSVKSEVDLAAATASALEEWQRIRTALDLFAQNLGPAFQPLPSEYRHAPQAEPPFGSVLQYRSYDTANIWALYYMCHIILLRAHPHMPPAAMIAAGVAAPQTAPYANLIGQIAAGIALPAKGQPLNPSVGACLCEICMPLFFAGVQFREAAQRTWLVERVREIERRTGWASLGMIALGCETAWVKAADAGRGPPWNRIYVDDGRREDERVTRRGGHLDPQTPPKDLTDRRFIHVNPPTRVHWAVGLLADNEDEREVEHAE